jgi:carbon-monoxide dehydrogenase large subunit
MYMGTSVRRLEDRRFLTGAGRYVDDIAVGTAAAHAIFVRSAHANADLKSVSVDVARAMPGVLCVLTGEDYEKAGLGRFVVWSPVSSTDKVERPPMMQAGLAKDRVCYVGEPIAVVVAETKQQALDAAEAVEVEYTPRPSITDTSRALDPDAPLVHPNLPSNLAYVVEVGDAARVEAAFTDAAHVVELELVNTRITANPMEPRCILATYERATDQYTIWVSHQGPHMLRRDLAENTLRHPEHKIRVVAPDVGGGFGMKFANHPEEPTLCWAAKVVGRPVRWTSTRSEGLISDSQARDHWTKCRMAFDKDGRILAISADTVASLGAYQTRMGGSIPAQFYPNSLVGPYTIPAVHCRVRCVYTNAPPIQSYRGAGRPEANYVLESLIENGAHQMGIDPGKLRATNFIPASAFPYTTPLGLTYDVADPGEMWRKAQALFGYEEMREEQKRSRGGRLLLGIGIACFIDCVGAPSRVAAAFGRKVVGGWDSATVRIHPTGQVTVLAGSHSHGQGHATTYAQIAADALHCAVHDVEVIEGDTAQVQYGHGTWGSRSTITAGTAVHKAATALFQKCRAIAAHLLECSASDLSFEGGDFRVVGTDRRLPFRSVTLAAYQGGNLPDGMEPGLEQLAAHDPLDRSYASGLHLCAVTVDCETGRVTIRRYVAIDDCGRVINPMIVEGQAHGGIVQGVGQALMEHCAFDLESGQPLAGTFMDYAMPRASDFPRFDIGFHETPSPTNPLGVKGSGESGTIGALGAIRNAVVDALWPLGVRHIDMPITPARVWEALKAASKRR